MDETYDDQTEPSGPTSAAGEVGAPIVAERYELERQLGTGGFGTVWVARDRVTGDRVAIKLVRALSPAQIATSRREVTALRWAQIPGVVRLRDEGLHGTDWFIVLDLVEGRPFPGRRGAIPWVELRETVFSLLETLSTLHAVGLLHLDLKPGNVLVEGDGRVILLDFGLARGRALGEIQGGRAFTPRFAAPEQIRGQEPDVRTDLYALGLMLHLALAGRLPEEGSTQEIMEARLDRIPHSLSCWAPSVPLRVVRVVDRLLSRDPAERPSSAVEVWRSLGGTPPPLLGEDGPELALPDPLTHRTLAALFAGPDEFLHLREDAASLLWELTSGDRRAVQRQLAEWLRSGRIRWGGDRLVVDRTALARLRAEGTSTKGADQDPGRTAQAAARMGRQLVEAGRLVAARPLLEAGLAAARLARDRVAERKLLRHQVIAALAEEAPAALEPVLYELGRCSEPDAVEELERLVQVARAVRSGSATQAEELLARLDPSDDESLEQWRKGLEVEIARARGPQIEEALLEETRGWAAGSSLREGKRLSWLGSLRYRQNRFQEAADLHARSAECRSSAHGRLSARINAAGALLDALQLVAAASLARDTEIEARIARHASFEAQSLWIQRAVSYRLGEIPDEGWRLVEAAGHISSYLEGLFAFQGAACAWRHGRRDAAARLARRATERFVGEALVWNRMLARALEGVVTQGSDPRRDADLTEQAQRCPILDLGVQTLGLLNLNAPDPERQRLAVSLALHRPIREWSVCLDVLSFEEATGRCRPPRC